MATGNIMIVDDNPNVITALSHLLEPEFNKVITISEPELIPGILELESIDVVLMDMNFKPGDSSGEEGLEWLKRILRIDSDSVVIMMTAYGEVELAVRAMKGGASDFIMKPWNNEKLIATLRTGLQLRQSRNTVRNLKHKQAHLNQEILGQHSQLIGRSAVMASIKKMITRVASTDSSILILGENGTGKELIAREIHNQSLRNDEVFVHVDMGAISDTLFESELFGHVKGAFTDAGKDRAGRFEIASGGTLFLDEIGNLPLNLQSKLLNVIQNRKVFRLGSNKAVKVDFRLICATNQDLKEMVQTKRFREDLYYRINTIEITSPPLRDRDDDMLILADYFLEEFKQKHHREDLSFSRAYKQYLLNQDWPGNIRQLRNHVEKAVILSESPIITPEEIHSGRVNGMTETARRSTLSSIQKEAVLDILRKNRGNISRTAAELGVARSTVYNKLKRFGLKNPRSAK